MSTAQLTTLLEQATWLPSATKLRALMLVEDLDGRGERQLLRALETKRPAAIEHWTELVRQVLPKDSARQLDEQTLHHALVLTKTRTVAEVRKGLLAIVAAKGEQLAVRREAFLELGRPFALDTVHPLYAAAARHASVTALPSAPPHLGGPLPKLSALETVEFALRLTERVLEVQPDAFAATWLERARAQRHWLERREGAAPVNVADVPAPGRSVDIALAFARAAAHEACALERGTGSGAFILSEMPRGLAVKTESWWLAEVDEALLLGDARTAWALAGPDASVVQRVCWRGGDDTAQHWLIRLPSAFALLTKTGPSWSRVDGDFDAIVATIPARWFEAAVRVAMERR